MRAFLGRGDSEVYHSALCLFVSGSYAVMPDGGIYPTDLYSTLEDGLHGRFVANVGRIELASAIFTEEFGALLAAIFE